MVRLMVGLAVGLLGAASVQAGELDGDFPGAQGKAPKAQVIAISTALTALAQKTDAKSALAKGSELDDESPAQAYRGGWGRGWGGWGRGSGGWGRGWGGWGWGGWGRGWYGYRGWGGGGWGWPYYARAWRWGYGWPYYASLYLPSVGYYSYAPAYYDPYAYCW